MKHTPWNAEGQEQGQSPIFHGGVLLFVELHFFEYNI